MAAREVYERKLCTHKKREKIMFLGEYVNICDSEAHEAGWKGKIRNLHFSLLFFRSGWLCVQSKMNEIFIREIWNSAKE